MDVQRGASEDTTKLSGRAAHFEMIAPSYCQLMARYNRWMNERLYALLAAVDDAERKRDRGAFFGSMHGTLNHLLWGDLMWLGRFVGEPCSVPAFGADMFADFAQLAREREVTDRRILDWAGGVSSEWLAGTLAYRSRVDGRNSRAAVRRRHDALLQPRHASPRTAHDADETGGRGPRCHRPAVAAGRRAVSSTEAASAK